MGARQRLAAILRDADLRTGQFASATNWPDMVPRITFAIVLASRATTDGAIAPAAPQSLALRACGAARSDARAGSRSWRSFRSPRGCSEPSSRASRVQARPESPECLCRLRADGLRRNDAANEERASCAAPRLSPRA